MTYEEQLKVEQLNKEIINNIIANTKPEDFISFYLTHNQKETIQEYGLRTIKQLVKILTIFNYDFSKPKPSKFKGQKSARSHESYIKGGQKSAETQKQNWENKSEEEKEAWSKKMSESHLTSLTFKDKITRSNRAFRNSLTEEQKADMDLRRSQTMKAYWESLSEEEKEILKNSNNGKTYNISNSTPNKTFASLLDQNNILYEREYSLERKHYDFKINNILIEINPTFTHNSTFTPFKYNKPLEYKYHYNKSQIAINHGFRCIHIFDWDNSEKVIDLVKKQNIKIAARDCEIKLVNKKEAVDFINENHLQNYAKDSIRYGLYYNNELVSIMTFAKPRYNKKYDYEIIRYCSKYNITGGAEKLYKHFIEDYKPNSVISYCDLSKFNGSVYNKLGFNLLRINMPSKHWYNKKTKEHYTDALIRQHGFSRIINGSTAEKDNLVNADNKTLMINSGFVEIYDCGQAVYIWKKELN